MGNNAHNIFFVIKIYRIKKIAEKMSVTKIVKMIKKKKLEYMESDTQRLSGELIKASDDMMRPID